MGIFDNIIKDIASGEIDKKLEKFADRVEHLSGKLDSSVDKLAKQPENIAKGVDKVKTEAVKTIKVIHADDDGELAA